MAALAWIICIGTFLGGVTAQNDLPRALGETLSTGLFAASFFACPAVWKIPPLSDLLNGKQRAAACIALLLSVPLVLMPA
ncbi:MAG: hypothetical protein R3E11_11950 [Sphingobium sp.]|nr:hypothetical protein [Sphingobium sp.]MCP5400598.1 hypothetical protein [Sphingomonas sp.]